MHEKTRTGFVRIVLVLILLVGTVSVVSSHAQPVTKPSGKTTLVIKSRVQAGPWNSDTAIYPLKGQRVVLRIDEVPAATPRWYRIVPDTSEIYKNANHPWEPDPYKWIGLARIKYSRIELTGFRGKWEIEPFVKAAPSGLLSVIAGSIRGTANATAGSPHDREDAGSFWFQVEVEKAGRVERSAGIEDGDKKGLSPKVFRVSIRDGEGYLGYLTSFFNVPGVFGCIPHQSNNYIGIDCCDVLVAARGKWTGKTIEKNYSVSMLATVLSKLAEFDLTDGKPNKRLEWGKQIHPGNFIAVRYNAGKGYQHIGALFSDADKNGVLSEGDLILHAGPLPLHFSYLKEGKFDGHALVLDHKSGDLAGNEDRIRKAAREID